MAFLPEKKQAPLQPTDSNLIPEEYRRRHDAVRRLSGTLGLVVSLLIMSASVAAYGGVLFYVSGLRTQIGDIQASLAAITLNRDKAEELRILNLDRQLRSADELVKGHVYMSALLKRIEELTHPLVRFDSLNLEFDSKTGVLKMTVGIISSSYRIIAEQIVSFRQSEFVRSVEISEFSLSAEGLLLGQGIVQFNISALSAEEDFFDSDASPSAGDLRGVLIP